MNKDEQELAKIAVQEGIKPFVNMCERLFGGTIDEIGGMWKDSFHARRIMRQIPLFKKVQAAIHKAGFDPRQIADNISVPILQAALLEDDETMQERWANLLANASDPRQASAVLPSFAVILKELTPRDAKFLDALYEGVSIASERGFTQIVNVEIREHELTNIYVKAGLSRRPSLSNLSVGEVREGGAELVADLAAFEATVGILKRNGILSETVSTNDIDLRDITRQIQNNNIPRSLAVNARTVFQITELGAQFIMACRAPTPLT
jgi:hypothetical protein